MLSLELDSMPNIQQFDLQLEEMSLLQSVCVSPLAFTAFFRLTVGHSEPIISFFQGEPITESIIKLATTMRVNKASCDYQLIVHLQPTSHLKKVSS